MRRQVIRVSEEQRGSATTRSDQTAGTYQLVVPILHLLRDREAADARLQLLLLKHLLDLLARAQPFVPRAEEVPALQPACDEARLLGLQLTLGRLQHGHCRLQPLLKRVQDLVLVLVRGELLVRRLARDQQRVVLQLRDLEQRLDFEH